MYERILCPIDGSAQSDRALALACDLASLYEARLTLLHAVGPDTYAAADLRRFAEQEGLTRGEHEAAPVMPAGASASEVMAPAVADSREAGDEAQARVRLGEQLLEHARPEPSFGAPVDTALVHGDPARAILDEAKAREIDLIVMGSRGLGKVRELLLGSVSSRVSRDAPCTCITVS